MNKKELNFYGDILGKLIFSVDYSNITINIK